MPDIVNAVLLGSQGWAGAARIVGPTPTGGVFRAGMSKPGKTFIARCNEKSTRNSDSRSARFPFSRR